MKSLCTWVFGIALASSATAESSWYCESGDPGGGGPAAYVHRLDDGTFRIGIAYNRRDLDSNRRSSDFAYVGLPAYTDEVLEQDMSCIRHEFVPRGRRRVHLFLCENEEVPLITLVNFTRLNPDYQMGCQ